MRAAGVPVIPGCDAVSSVEEAKEQARQIGFPLLIKARAGGGGRGIRLVKEESELEAAYPECFPRGRSRPLAMAGLHGEIPISGQTHRDADSLRQLRQRGLPGRARMLESSARTRS